MGVIERLFGRQAGAPAESTTPPHYGSMPMPWVSSATAMGVSAVWRCVTLISDTLADMPWTEWRGTAELQPSRLVTRPMQGMDRREWTWRVVATEALYNTVYLLHVGGTDREGVPWSLMPLPPGIVQPAGTIDPWGLTLPTEYRIGGFPDPISVDYLTIIRRAPIPGISEQVAGILDIARNQFAAYIGADTHTARYWRSGGPTLTYLTSEADIPDPLAEDIAQRWMDRRALGADVPAVLGNGLEAKAFGADPTTDSAVDARREMAADIGRHFGVPTRILNAPAGDSETYSNVENDAIDLWRYTLRGYAGPLERAISSVLPGDTTVGRRMELDPARLLQGSFTERSTAWTAIVAAGIADVDEARVRGFGLPARAGTEGVVQQPAPTLPVVVEV